MENTREFNPDPGTIERSALLIDRVHSCTDCPIRRLAIERPHSVFGRMHAWHKTWWPGWRVHRARVCAMTARAGTRG